MADFISELSNIQQSNPMGGLILSAQAKLLRSQTESTQKIVQNFSSRLQELESSPLTVEEQLKRLNEDPDVKESFQSLTDELATFQQLTYDVYDRQVQMNKIYGETINALAYTGGETAERVGGALKGQHAVKSAELERLSQLPFESLQYKSTLLNIENAKFNIQESQFKLQQLKEDKESMKLFAEIVDSPEFSKLLLSYNTATGKRTYNLGEFQKSMFLRFGNDPSFINAWLATDKYIRESTMTYRPEFRDLSGMGASLAETNLMRVALYNDLKDTTNYFNKIQQTPEFSDVRKMYYDAAVEMYGEPKTSKYHSDYNKYIFGFDGKVIRAMESGEAKNIAEDINNVMYNPDHEDSYQRRMNQFKQLMNTSDLTGMNNARIVDPSTPEGVRVFDLRQIITFDGGYKNIGDPSSFIPPGKVTKELSDTMQTIEEQQQATEQEMQSFFTPTTKF